MSDGPSAPKGTVEIEGGAPKPPENEAGPGAPAEPDAPAEASAAPADANAAPAAPAAAPKVAPTMVDEPVPAAPVTAEDAPWAKPGKTQPGEPPIFDVISPAPPMVAPAAFPPVMAAPQPIAPAPIFYPAPAPMPASGGSNLGLIMGGLIGGLAVVGGIIALVVVMRGGKTDEPVNPIPITTSGGTTEVKPDMPAGAADTPETPPPVSPDPVAPVPAKTASPANTVKPTPKPTATNPPLPPPPQPTQPATNPTLPPPPPPAPTSSGGGRLKWKKN
jgi:hypothetical protein